MKARNMNRLMTTNEHDSEIKSVPSKKRPGTDSFISDFHHIVKIVLNPLKCLQNLKSGELANSLS
jgi:hypothetical protein